MSTADFFERRRVRDFESSSAAAKNAIDAMRVRGPIEWMRLHINGTGYMIVEGWRIRPADEGDLPL